ncbi:RHS repeat-associated core domain protein containing protein [Herbaspirillum sp. CF444]|uniref:RHS repeat-associated core domain-containing protein n=1 Tax=Herbaspirillum sp. CF444 TaxID=1144319 RepID=UPI0002726E62|nr:RHS repeat-associated core domain-containing protein [Herbaspirillum sp. CF444]EJL88508.1 RHS repeat-associated core domain protein containing protein [Herbaspirillum sp. CF444]
MNTSILGYNGQRRDAVSGTYHLGNGYRAYNPVLMRFNCPDSWSPFGAGGINPYAYCDGDPVNRADPSGHLSNGSIFGLAGGLIGGIVLGVLTAGLALPAVIAIDATFAVAVQGIAMAIDHERLDSMGAGGWALLAGGSLLASVGGAVVGKVLGALKGTASRPFGGLMMEGEGGGAAIPLPGLFRNPRFHGLYQGQGGGVEDIAFTYEDQIWEGARLNIVMRSGNIRGIPDAHPTRFALGRWNGQQYVRALYRAATIVDRTPDRDYAEYRLLVSRAAQGARGRSLAMAFRRALEVRGIDSPVIATALPVHVQGPVVDHMRLWMNNLNNNGLIPSPALMQGQFDVIANDFADEVNVIYPDPAITANQSWSTFLRTYS